jgi:hypothetical protein
VGRRVRAERKSKDETLVSARQGVSQFPLHPYIIKCLYTKATVDKDTTAMIFWLKNRRPREWRDRRELEMAVPDMHSVVHEAAELVRARRREFQEPPGSSCPSSRLPIHTVQVRRVLNGLGRSLSAPVAEPGDRHPRPSRRRRRP